MVYYWMLRCFIVSLFSTCELFFAVQCLCCCESTVNFIQIAKKHMQNNKTLHVTFVSFFPSIQHFFFVNIPRTQQKTKTKNSIRVVRPKQQNSTISSISKKTRHCTMLINVALKPSEFIASMVKGSRFRGWIRLDGFDVSQAKAMMHSSLMSFGSQQELHSRNDGFEEQKSRFID